MEQATLPDTIETQESKSVRVVITDDHHMIRDLLTDIINSMSGFTVIAGAANGSELIDYLEKSGELPDICILDIGMPVLNGYDTQLIIKKRWPRIKTLVLSIYEDQRCIVQMLHNGANGFVSKQSSPKILREALSAIYNEGCYYEQITEDMLHAAGSLPLLTEREKEYLTLTCSELSMDDIAQKLNIHGRTVEHYRDNVYRKLHVSNKADLLFYVKRTGIVFMK